MAIRIHGDGGARIIFDVDDKDLEGFLKALVMRGHVLNVTLEVDD